MYTELLKRSLWEASPDAQVASIESKNLPNVGFEAQVYLFHILYLLEDEKRRLSKGGQSPQETVLHSSQPLFPDHVFLHKILNHHDHH